MSLFKSLICASALCAPIGLVAPVHADPMVEARATLDESLPGTLMHNPFKIKWAASGPDKRSKVVKAEGVPGNKAYQVRVKARQAKAWDIQLSLPMDTAVAKGDKVVMHFWARTEKPATGMETADFTAMVQRNRAPYDAIISEGVQPGMEWKLHTIEGIAESDFGDDSIQVAFQLGNAVQTVEFGQFYVSNLGQ